MATEFLTGSVIKITPSHQVITVVCTVIQQPTSRAMVWLSQSAGQAVVWRTCLT